MIHSAERKIQEERGARYKVNENANTCGVRLRL